MEGKDYPLQYFGLESSMGCIGYWFPKNQTLLGDFHFHAISAPLPCILPALFVVINFNAAGFASEDRIEVVSAQKKVSELIITHGDGLGIHALDDRTFHDQTMAAAISFLKIFTLILKLLTVLLCSGHGVV